MAAKKDLARLAEARALLAAKQAQIASHRKANPTYKAAKKAAARAAVPRRATLVRTAPMSAAEMMAVNKRQALGGVSYPSLGRVAAVTASQGAGETMSLFTKENPMEVVEQAPTAQKGGIEEAKKRLEAIAMARAAAKRSAKKASIKRASIKRASVKAASVKAASVKAASAKAASAKAASVKAASARKSSKQRASQAAGRSRAAAALAAEKAAVASERKVSVRKSSHKAIRRRASRRKSMPSVSQHGHLTKTVVTRTYIANPVVELKDVAIAGGGLLVGIIAADVLDRFVATRAPEGQQKPLYGQLAAGKILEKADSMRLLASGGGTALFGVGAFMARDRMPGIAYALGGVAAGFGVKFLGQLIGDHLMPLLFKREKADEESWANRLFPDKQEEASGGTTQGRIGLPAGYRDWANRRVMRSPYGYMGAPDAYPFASAPAAQNGAVGCGGGCGSVPYGGYGAGMNERLAAAMQSIYNQPLGEVFPSPGARRSCNCGVMPPAGGCVVCASQPSPVAPMAVPPAQVTPTEQTPITVPNTTQPIANQPPASQPPASQPTAAIVLQPQGSQELTLSPMAPPPTFGAVDQQVLNDALKRAKEQGFVRGPDGQVSGASEETVPAQAEEVSATTALMRMTRKANVKRRR